MRGNDYAILITTWSGPRLVETIHSIEVGERVLVVDGSQHGWPLARQWNIGIERLLGEGYRAVVVCNDDILLSHPNFEYVPPILSQALLVGGHGKSEDCILVTGYNLRSQPHTGPDQMREDEGLRWMPHPDFSCFCVDRRLFEQVGKFDESFVPAYFEDNDMHRRIVLAGFNGYSYAPYFHYGSSTVGFDKAREREVANRFPDLERYYKAKWGGGPGHETFTMAFNGARVPGV